MVPRACPWGSTYSTPVYKEWKNVTVFFGGSYNAVKALRLGIEISAVSGFPLLIFTQAEHRPRSHYEQVIEERGLLDELKERNPGVAVF